MKITTQITEVVENRFAGDFKQDLYIKILELVGETPTFETNEDINKWLSSLASNQYRNDTFQDGNRLRLMEENEDTIRNLYGYNDVADDPLDILLADGLEDSILKGLSELETDIYSRVQNGLSYEAIGEEFGMTYKAVQVTMSRIKGKFHAKENGKE